MSKQEKPFERLQPHKRVIVDINQMRQNLDRLEEEVRHAEWIELGGRGVVNLEEVDKACDATENSMSTIKEDIHELVEE